MNRLLWMDRKYLKKCYSQMSILGAIDWWLVQTQCDLKIGTITAIEKIYKTNKCDEYQFYSLLGILIKTL